MSHPTSRIPLVDDSTALAGLARELESLSRDVHELRDLPRRLDDLATTVAQLADTVAAVHHSQDGAPAPCWLDHPADPDLDPATSPAARDAKDLLLRLTPWVGAIYLRYSDAVSGFPDCWLWHPDVVEELLWLHQAWLSAFGPGASASAVGDWHDRQRPGVVARIRAYAGMCSLEAHRPGQDRATPAPSTPTADAAGAVATWWATARDHPGPTPTHAQLAVANDRWHQATADSRR